MTVQVQVLGGFEVVVDGVAVPAEAWRRRHASALVKLLALTDRKQLHREQVMDALWPDLTPESAAPRLHKAAHFARHAMGRADGVVLASDQLLLLPETELVVDVDRFDAAAAEAESAQNAVKGDGAAAPALHQEARRAAERAVHLYAGDLLPEDRFEPWAEEPREARRLRYLRLLRQAERWEELAEADPTHEEAHVRLAHAFAQRGDRAAALRQLDRLDQTLRNQLGVAAGPTAARLRRLVEDQEVAEPAASTSPRAATPVPALPVRIVGREHEVDRATALLDDSRILTLLGPGGVGKTTLAIEVARRRSAARAVEACFVDLTQVEQPASVAGLIAAELGLHGRDAAPEALLQEAVRGRSLVLVLDNFEHVVEAADVVARLTAWSSGLEVVSTSRARLRLTHEQVLDVPPFEVPSQHLEGEDGAGDAVRLFAQVAQAVDPSFDVGQHLPAVTEICRTVDGLPLAIKLAAGHVRTLSPAVLLARLTVRLGSPDGSTRDAPGRQRTIPATIDWSLQLVGEDEVRLFTRLSVFGAPAPLEAVEAVCGEAGEDLVPTLSRLVDQSLVQRVVEAGGEVRFRMLQLVRERSRQLLDAAAEADVIRERHATYVAETLERIEARRWDELSGVWIDLVRSLLAEIRVAHAWATRRGDTVLAARIVAALGTYWHRDGGHVEARGWVEQSLEHLTDLDDEVGGRLLVAAALLDWTVAPLRAREHWKGAIARFEAAGDERYLSYALGLAAGAHIGDREGYQAALRMSEQAIELGRAVGDRPLVAQSLNVLGELARNQGDDDLARRAYVEGLALADEAGDRAHRSVFMCNLAYLATHRGDYEEALRLAREGLELCWSRGLRMMAAWTVSEVAGPQSYLGRPELGARLVGAGDKALDTLGAARQSGDREEYERVVRRLRDLLGEQRYEELVAEGAELTLDQAVALALEDEPSAAPAHP